MIGTERFIDIDFDFRSDAGGYDPDAYSPTLKKYHRLLWSKRVPAGGELVLDKYLNNTSPLGAFAFSSDSIIHSFARWKRYQHIISEVPAEDIDSFVRMSYTIGGMLIFPRNRVNGLHTINQTRGTNPLICDRFDLTLECIRRYYNGEESPLYDCLCRYRPFFDLFVDFKGYVDFFLLQDMVSEDYSDVRFFHPFEEFKENPLPPTVEVYMRYREKAMVFVRNRNKRIECWVGQHIAQGD